ncbi:MAG: RNA-binding transcriptional accessory protein [Clostridia bacterium]|nr:RNA-binding transcriptional accessory protein [Clostridia bacterium]
MTIAQQLAQELNLKQWQVDNTIALIDEGNTIPFISRYRKEATGELNDEILRAFDDRLTYLRNMEERKADIKRIIEEQGKLTDELVAEIDKAQKLSELEDIYRPYRPKRRTRATVAKEKGLEPLATMLYMNTIKDETAESAAKAFVDAEKGVETVEDALLGAMDIIAEMVSDNAEHRKKIRELTAEKGLLVSKAQNPEEDSVYRNYYDFSEAVSKAVPHRVLAINRGESEKVLSVKIEIDEESIIAYLKKKELPKEDFIGRKYVESAIEDAYSRLIQPAIEREVRNELTDIAHEQAMQIFRENLKNLLMQAPIRGQVVLGLDPGYRTGCKVGVVDETGRVLDTGVIYITHSDAQRESAKTFVKSLIEKYNITLISIGNGTASKETEIFVSKLIKETTGHNVKYIMTNEAGASVYSASKLAAEEFPDFDVTQRSAISIARRVQDPLAELVKIDPKAIGVGQYQHDMNQKRLGEVLGGVVEDCVNSVGVDLNTASAPLLQYVSGISTAIAQNIVKYREEEGCFTNRSQLKKVAKLGPKAFQQCAGFLRIAGGKNVFDNTAVHPESYEAAEKLIANLGYTVDDVKNNALCDIDDRMKSKDLTALAEGLGVGVPTLRDIVEEIKKPGRDPRDSVEQPLLREDVMSMEDLKPDMLLTGTVRNVIDFGAFVDIGVHQDGLVHISQLSDKFVKHPMDVVSIGDIVKVKVLEVDVAKKRISLTMKGV